MGKVAEWFNAPAGEQRLIAKKLYGRVDASGGVQGSNPCLSHHQNVYCFRMDIISGQNGQTVNLLAQPSKVRILLHLLSIGFYWRLL